MDFVFTLYLIVGWKIFNRKLNNFIYYRLLSAPPYHTIGPEEVNV